MSNKQTGKNQIDHSVASPKRNQTQNYYSQLLGRTNSHFYPGFLSPQLHAINQNHIQHHQNPILNSLQLSSQNPSQQFQAQQQQPQAISQNPNQNNGSNINNPNNIDNNKNNFKLTDILSTRYSSGTLKLIRNGQTSTSSNPRQLSSDARQLDVASNYNSNNNQNKEVFSTPTHNSKNQVVQQQQGVNFQNTQNNQQNQAPTQQNHHHNNVSRNTQQVHKSQIINSSKCQTSSNLKQQHSHTNHTIHNTHNIHSGNNPNISQLNINSGNQQIPQSSTISPRTISNLVQDKLMRSKQQNQTKNQQPVQQSGQGSVKEQVKNSQASTKRPKSLKQIDNDHFSINNGHQVIHEQNMNILANMTLNNRNGSEKNLMKSHQTTIQNLMAQSVTSHSQYPQSQQHQQQLHSSKIMLSQQQNSLHSTETINNLMASSKGSNFNTTGPSSQVNQKYELNQSKHQTSHSLEKFRGQSESIDHHQFQKQQESLAYQVQKVIMNKQQQQYHKKTNDKSDANSKSRNKRPQDQQRNQQIGHNKKQQPINPQNLSQSQYHNIHQSPQLTSINHYSSNTNQLQASQSNNQLSQNYHSNPVQSSVSANNNQNYNSKQTLSAITQRIQQNLNTLNDPIQAIKNSGIQSTQNFLQINIHQNYLLNIDDPLNNEAVENLQYDLRLGSQDNKRDNSAKRMFQQSQLMDSQLNTQNIQKSKSSLYESNKIKSNQQQIQTEENLPSNLILSQVQLQTNQIPIHQNINQYNSNQRQNNHESSNSNTPQGKPVNTNYNKQQPNAQNKDNKNQIYFMKEKERGFKKHEYLGSKNKRKGEQSQPHSNSQGVPQILMSNSVTNTTQNQYGNIYALQKSQGQIPNGQHANINPIHFMNSNIMKSLSKDNLKSEEDRVIEQQSNDQLSNSQYQNLICSQQQGQFDDPKEIEGQIIIQNDNVQIGNHHGKRNSLPEGNLYKKQFVNTEGSYLGDLRTSDIFPFISPKSLTTYHPVGVGGQVNTNSGQTAQNKHFSTSPTQKNNSQNLSQPNQQIQQLGSSFQQTKSINPEQGSEIQMSDQTKYLQSLFNNFFSKDSKSKQNDKVNNTEPQENTFLNGSTINIYKKEENANISSNSVKNDSQKQTEKQVHHQHVSSDQKLEDIQLEKPQYNLKNQLRQEKDKSSANNIHTEANPMNIQIRFKQQSCSNQVSAKSQNNQSPPISQSQSQNNSVNVSPLSQFKSEVLSCEDQFINKSRNEMQKDGTSCDDQSNYNRAEFSSLNSSQIDVKNRQSIHNSSNNNLKEPIITYSQNNISQNQFVLFGSNMNLNKQMEEIKLFTTKILNNYRNCLIEHEQATKEKDIQISNFNQILLQKDNQFNYIQSLNEQYRKQLETQNIQIAEKDNLIVYLQSQIQQKQNSVFNQQQNNLIQNNPFNLTISQKNSQNNLQDKIQTNSQFNSQTNSQNNSQYNQNIMINNYTSSPLVNRSISDLNNSFSANSPAQKINDIENDCALGRKQSSNYFEVNRQQDIRYSLPVFSKEYFKHSQDTSDRNQNNSQSSPSNQGKNSADFTGNQEEISLDSLKKKYQINSVNKKQKSKITQSQQFTKSGEKHYQMFSSVSSQYKTNQKKGSYNHSENNDEEKDPLNDSTKLLKQISKQQTKGHNLEKSENSQDMFSSRKQSYSSQEVKPFQNNLQNQQFNVFSQPNDNQNVQYFGGQGSFNNLQALEKQNTINFDKNIDQINQNIEAIQQQNQLNTSGNFSNGNACFGSGNDDENSQNNENSFGEQNFNRFNSKSIDQNKEQSFSPFDNIISSQKQSINIQYEQNTSNQKTSNNDMSFRSKSSTQNKQNQVGNNNSPLNDSFSCKQTPVQSSVNNNSFQQNKLNDSFSIDNQIRNDESFSNKIQQNESKETDHNKQNDEQQNQANISFEGFGQQQSDQKQPSNNNNQDNIQENEKLNALLEEQQSNISFTNQSFG